MEEAAAILPQDFWLPAPCRPPRVTPLPPKTKVVAHLALFSMHQGTFLMFASACDMLAPGLRYRQHTHIPKPGNV